MYEKLSFLFKSTMISVPVPQDVIEKELQVAVVRILEDTPHPSLVVAVLTALKPFEVAVKRLVGNHQSIKNEFPCSFIWYCNQVDDTSHDSASCVAQTELSRFSPIGLGSTAEE